MVRRHAAARSEAEHGDDDGHEAMHRLALLARFTSDKAALTRLYLTPEHKAAAGQVEAWMREAGLATRLDATGNVVGRLEGQTKDAPAVLIGSHIDTVRNAGKYDGNLGVVVAIQAMKRLKREGLGLPFAVEVIAFGDEEGVRFPVTLTGSKAVAGIFDPATLEAKDHDGVTLFEALKSFGCDPGKILAIKRDPEKVVGYVEVHIEQGPVLEAHGLPVGVVTAISGASRLKVAIHGVAGHAGTVPMNLRHDAVAAAAEMILAVERVALLRPDVVATVGEIEVPAGAVNTIAANAQFSIDVRSPSDGLRHRTLREIRRAFEAIAAYRSVYFKMTSFYDVEAAVCSSAIVRALERSVAANHVSPFRLASGAGHDGLAMAKLAPFGMLFVRCKGGVSHNPAESVETEDVRKATDVLADFLLSLEPKKIRR